MVQALNSNYSGYLSPRENKFNEKVFHDCQKNVKKSEVRDADWGLYAAQTCLAKSLVSASPEETELVMKKMDYVQKLINQNMEQDQDIFSREMKDKGTFIITKAEAKSKVLPARAELIKASGDTTVKLLDSATGAIKEVTVPKLDIAA